MFKNLSIRSRLLLILSSMSVVAVLLTSIGLFGVNYSNSKLKTVYIDRAIPLRDLKVIADMYAVNIVDTSHKVRNGNITWEEAVKNVDDAVQMIDKKWKGYLSSTLVEKELELVEKIKPQLSESQLKIEKLKGILNAKNHLEIEQFTINELYPAIDPISALFSSLIELQLDVVKQEYESSQVNFEIVLISSLVLLFFGLSTAIFLGLAIIRNLTNSMNNAQNVATEIANGNLNSTIVIEGNDEITVLLKAMQIMQSNLNTLAEEVKHLVSDAVKGKYDTKISLAGKSGFSIDISQELNTLSNLINTGLHDVIRVSDALSKGDLSQKITQDYKGLFGLTAKGVNGTVDALTKIVNEIQGMVDAGANKGEFSYKMSINDKAGYTKTIAESLNRLSNVIEDAFNDIERVVNGLEEGDLTQEITKSYVGVFDKVKVGMNNTTENLKNLMAEIKETTEVIASASTEIAAGNNDLSQRTEQQAASLEETATSMQELTSTVAHNSENAKQANDLAVGATNIANKGVLVVQEVVNTMENINQSSLRIVDIISVIDDIAFQTNILALNAAVEAARAGEQGKGFAVVATEVRNLAQRAANAAGEIKRLIGDSVERVSGGSKQVEEAGKTMQDIVEAIEGVTAIIGEIASESEQQNAGIRQVGQAISSMDDVTQQNAALVEQVAATAESLETQTQNLAKELGHFKINATGQKSNVKSVKNTVSPTLPSKSRAIPAPSSTQPVSTFSIGDDWEEF